MDTFGDALAQHARERPDAVALRFGDRVTSYAAFDRHASQVANALIAAGAGKGALRAKAVLHARWPAAGHRFQFSLPLLSSPEGGPHAAMIFRQSSDESDSMLSYPRATL